MSVVLALALAAVVISAVPRRRRGSLSRAVATIGGVGRLVRSAAKVGLAAIAAGAVLLLFGQQASAQSDETPEPPPSVQPAPGNGATTEEADVAPGVSESPDVGDDPASPPAVQAPDEGSGESAGTDATTAPAPPDPPAVPTLAGDAPSTPAEPVPVAAAPEAPPSSAPAAPPPPVVPTTPPAVPVAAPKASNIAAWNVPLAGRALVRSSGATITIQFDGEGPELMRPSSDVSGIVITGSDGDDSLEVSDDVGVHVRYDGGDGADALVMPASGGTVRFMGSRAGELLDRFGALLVSFAGVDDLISGPGSDTFVAERRSDLRALQMAPGDRLVVELETGADGAAGADLLTVESVDLAGTLEVHGGSSSSLLGSTPVPFLSFGTAHGDFTSFRGLDLGDGAYVRPTTVAGGYELRAAELPDEIAIRFPSSTDADEFFTFLAGKGHAFRSATPVRIELRDDELTGDLTLSGTPDTAILELTDAQLRFGGGPDALLTLDDDAATLTLTDSNLSGTIDGSLTTSVPDVSFGGPFSVALDTDDPSIVAVGNRVTVTIAGYTFSGVDIVVAVVGEGADLALRITGPTGGAVTIPRAGPSALDVGALAAALEQTFGVSLASPAAAGADATVSLDSGREVGTAAIATSTESTARDTRPLITAGEQRSLVNAGDVVSTVLDSLGPLLALAGVAGPLVVAASTSSVRGGSSRVEPTPMGATVVAAPVLLAPRSIGAPVDEPRAVVEVTTTAPARGPPAGTGTAIASEIPVRFTSSAPQRIPGRQVPFVVTPTGRVTAEAVESGWVDRAPGALLPLFVLLHLLWTRGRRSTRPLRPCRRRARGSLLANGDEGGVTGGSWRRRRCGHRRRHALRSSQRPVRAGRSLRAARLEGGRSAMSDEWSWAAHRSSRRGWCGASRFV